MKKLPCKQIIAGLMSSVMFCSVLPASGALSSFANSIVYAEDAESTENIIYYTDFEDGVNDFTGRDGVSTVLISDSEA